MKILYCWRCNMDVPMLDEQEFAKIEEVYPKRMTGPNLMERLKLTCQIYNEITGSTETNPNMVVHHRISMYGPQCPTCHKPFRTPQATKCVGCGWQKT